MTFDLLKTVAGAASAELMTVNIADIEKQQAVRRAAEEKANPRAPESLDDEYARLKRWGDSLGERLRGSESNVNRAADRVKGLEKQLADLTLYLQTARLTPNQQVRLKSRIENCEADIVEAKRWLENMRKINTHLLAEQRSFPTKRFGEIKKLLAKEDACRKALPARW